LEGTAALSYLDSWEAAGIRSKSKCPNCPDPATYGANAALQTEDMNKCDDHRPPLP